MRISDWSSDVCSSDLVLARALSVRGLMNIQFAVKDGVVYLIEVNPRASRTVPFVAKAIGTPIAKIASRVMAGEKLKDLPRIDRNAIGHIAEIGRAHV